MAFIYQYEMDKKLGKKDLTGYSDVLNRILEREFGKNLKETYIDEEMLEFRLYKSVDAVRLRNLGKKMKRETNVTFGFRRRRQQLYFIIDKINEETESVIVDIVDGMVGVPENYRQRASSFFTSEGLAERIETTEIADGLRNSLYLDVCSAEVDKSFLLKMGIDEIQEGDCFLTYAWHRKTKEILQADELLKGRFVQVTDAPDYAYHAALAEENTTMQESETGGTDYFGIIGNGMQREDLPATIQNLFSINLEESEKIEVEDIKNKSMEFCVHNVGQALATSFSVTGETPFLYFDYGLPFGKNAMTKPVGTKLPVKENGVIILSHVHQDHWMGLAKCPEAYTCRWYMPNQHRGVQLNHKIAEIIVAGGRVYTVPTGVSDMWAGKIHISCSGISAIKTARTATKCHETGLAMNVLAKGTDGKEFHILIEGDQDYDYVEKAFLKEVDLLVVCHHGGKYSWTGNAALPLPKNGDSCAVYSYGAGNTYGHPSKRKEHQRAGWKKEHDTINGDYRVEIQL